MAGAELPPVALNHLSLSVADLDRSLAFYRDLLGTPVLVEPYDGVRFDGRIALVRIGSLGLDLQEHTANGDERFDPARSGLDHLGFAAGSVAELEAWAARLDDARVQRSPIRDIEVGWMFDFEDPDGIQLEFLFVDPGRRRPS
jgi:glyoxylase I family protein